MEDSDPLMREAQRGKRLRRSRALGCIDFSGRHGKAQGGEIDAVEFLRIANERRISLRHDIGDDLLHGLIDIGRGLALGGQQGGKGRPEIGAAHVEPLRHDLFLSMGILC